MPRYINPSHIFSPSTRQSQGIVVSARARRLVIGSQVGLLPDGTIAEGLEAQLKAACDNVMAILADAGMAVHDLVRVSVIVTVPGSIHVHRQMLDAMLSGHKPTMNFMEVSGLAQPEFLVSIEGEAVFEDSDALFDAMPGSGVAATAGTYEGNS